VPRKNLHPLLGKPLIVHVAPVISNVSYVDSAVVSTDDPEIAAAAGEAGMEVPFMRPAELAGDSVGDQEVLEHALLETERLSGDRYDVVVMLQPTSPLRRPEHVGDAIEKLVDEGWDAVWTVSRTDSKWHPLKQLTIDGDGAMQLFDERGVEIVARQQLSPVYHRNGAAYSFTRDCLLEQRTTMGRRTGAVLIDEPMISIDTLEDFEKAERVLGTR
jgi:CMP-N,N'-diacetyllegionaminic acid synthase